jgi:hypothetical protein
MFWSSGPSSSARLELADECLIYKLNSPLCRVKFVQLAVYRELHQTGWGPRWSSLRLLLPICPRHLPTPPAPPRNTSLYVAHQSMHAPITSH